MLLERHEVNPGASDNEAIRSASDGGRTGIVRMLLQRTDVDPDVNGNIALIAAAN